ncbi:MAG: DUF86 domain-containing protein [Candidatus Atribacteria bacterium]|nr:DUF86 domain-containing protein [Candidatus Atribacteria bacterium]
MPDEDIVLAKVAIIQRCLHRIKEITNFRPESLDDLLNQDAFILNLQRAVQASIDLAAHIVAFEALGFPLSLKENFRLLYEKNIIDQSLAYEMQQMVSFRNIAVHDYRAIDINVLRSILTKHLKDIEDFYTTILYYYGLVNDQS